MIRFEFKITYRDACYSLAGLFFGVGVILIGGAYTHVVAMVRFGILAWLIAATLWALGRFRDVPGYVAVIRFTSSHAGIGVWAIGIAAFIAGRRRNVGSAWVADLRGDPEAERGLTRKQRMAMIAGFFLAAFRYRLHDWFGWTWGPVDWMLATKSRRDGFRTSVVGIHAIYIAGANGLHALFTLGLGWLAVTYAFVTGTTTWLAKRRGIELASDEDPPQE